MRADAQRNYDALVNAGREAFAEHGEDASLDDIAKRAGVGPGTLYRHFRNRDELLAAVYMADITELAERTKELVATKSPGEALDGFFAAQLEMTLRKMGMLAAIKRMLAERTETYDTCRTQLYEAADLVIGTAQRAGEVRTDVDSGDILRLLHGVAQACTITPESYDKLTQVIRTGLRPPAATPA